MNMTLFNIKSPLVFHHVKYNGTGTTIKYYKWGMQCCYVDHQKKAEGTAIFWQVSFHQRWT